MDAQRGEVFATLVDVTTGVTLEPPIASDPARLLASWRAHLDGRLAVFIGDAVERDVALIAAAGAGQWLTRTPPPLAPALARLARVRAERGEAGLPHQLTPIYVRRPDVEVERERRGTP
jgi:tRNA A37 threonylcarbamoyladenosine modification protein TsaB